MCDSTTTSPSMRQHLSSIAEAMRVERLTILGILTRYPAVTRDVAIALNDLKSLILERNEK